MPRNRSFALIVSCLSLTLCASAANQADFSGTWKLNADKSEFGLKAPGPPPSQTIVIIQTGTTITVKTIDATPPQADMTIKTDGTEGNIPSGDKGKEATASATWDGSNLTITIRYYDRKHRPLKGVGATALWSISPDGATLSQAHRATGAGFVLNARLVFDKQGSGTSTDPAAGFRKSILAALHAAEEPDPFASIRGEFDLTSSTGAWKTFVQLPEAEKCLLMKTPLPAASAPASWTYLCIFPPSINTYDRVVALVRAALRVDYQPNENAANANEVVFSDPSKLAWKVVVNTTSNPSTVMLRITPQQLVTSKPESGPSPAQRPGTTSQTSGGSISDEIDKISSSEHVPFPPIQPIGATSSSASPNGMGAFAVKNDTPYTLTVLFSGPTERRVEIAPGGSLSIELLPGAYKVAARVNAPDVSPSYGEHVFDRSSSGVTFYIQ